jgi:subtilisin family serine protease
VAATDEFNGLASFSNYGAVSVDLGAPGVRILTTHPDGYVEFHGSSAATPHVAGVAALLMARHPQAGPSAVAQAMVKGVEALPQLQGKTLAGGRLNAAGALRQLGDEVPYDAGKPGSGGGGGDGDGGDKVGAKQISKKKWCKRHRRHGHRHRRCRRH